MLNMQLTMGLPRIVRMKTRVSLALAVMVALALAQARVGRPERMRSLVGGVPYPDTG